MGELDSGEGAVTVNGLGHQRQPRQVAVVPQPALREGQDVAGGVNVAFLRRYHGQPPSALTPRMAASARGMTWPMPLQCGTW